MHLLYEFMQLAYVINYSTLIHSINSAYYWIGSILSKISQHKYRT
jgi:hypothetical protein